MTVFSTIMLAVLLLADPGGDGPMVETVGWREKDAEKEVRDGDELSMFRSGAGDTLTVSGGRVDFDRAEGVVMLDDGARVDYGGAYFMNARQMFVFFTGSNEFDRIVAIGNVAVTNENRSGFCSNAVFRRKSGEIEMHAFRDGRPAELKVGEHEAVRGKSVRFWVDTEQVVVDDSEVSFDRSGDGARKRGLEVLK